MKKLSGLKIMYSLLGLSIISLASIGFANWVIINTESKRLSPFPIMINPYLDYRSRA